MEEARKKLLESLTDREPTRLFDASQIPKDVFRHEYVNRRVRQHAQGCYPETYQAKLQQLAEVLEHVCGEAGFLASWNRLAAQDGHPPLHLDAKSWEDYLALARMLSQLGGESALEFSGDSSLHSQLSDEVEKGRVSHVGALLHRWDEIRAQAGYPPRLSVNYDRLQEGLFASIRSLLQQSFFPE